MVIDPVGLQFDWLKFMYVISKSNKCETPIPVEIMGYEEKKTWLLLKTLTCHEPVEKLLLLFCFLETPHSAPVLRDL